MIYLATLTLRNMKKPVVEKGFVIVLFIMVIIAFSFAERDTQKLFEKYNTKSVVKTSKQTIEYTAQASEKNKEVKKAICN